MKFRQARLTDLPAAAAILRDAARRMLAEGKCQWSESYPREEHVLADIERGVAYVMVGDDGRVVGYSAVVFTGEPAYDDLDGEWLSDGDYVVAHRVAVAQDSQCRGIGGMIFAAIEHLAAGRGIGSFRIDTNFDNERMISLLGRCGFAFTGLVHYPQGERRAYEKLI